MLITGPTGSGKTSTLYSALADIHSPERNIVTLEDPVEVQMAGITQVQVHERSGLTFSRGLRAVLRQDPDVVLVGEVRDSETAELALRASLTGHLVLTTLHTNDAVSAMTRLVDMGVEPFLVASSLSAVVAQRLVRRPCQGCLGARRARTPPCSRRSASTRRCSPRRTPVRGEGCARLRPVRLPRTHRRLRGSPRRPAPAPGARPRPDRAGHRRAAASGMRTLRDAATAKALAGETTFEEVARVSPRD